MGRLRKGGTGIWRTSLCISIQTRQLMVLRTSRKWGCPYDLGIRVGSKCGHMHADHTTGLNNILTSWEEAQMHTGRAWHSGLNADMLVSSIFEFSANHLVFRCKFCHSKLPHYQHFISKRDLAGEGSFAHPIVIEDDS